MFDCLGEFDIEEVADEMMSLKVRFKAKRLSFSCCLFSTTVPHHKIPHPRYSHKLTLKILVVELIFEGGLFSFSPFNTLITHTSN